MKKIIVGILFTLFSFTYMSSAVAGGKCPFGGSPNWQGVCDTTTDSGQSYFGPSLTQEQADEIGPAPVPPPPAPQPSPTPTVKPEDQVEKLLTLVRELLSQNNTLINTLTGGPSPSPSPSPTNGASSPTPSPSPTPTDGPTSTEPSTEDSVSPSPSATQTEETDTNTEISQRSISVKPIIVDNSLIINKRINESIFNNRVIVVATKGTSKKTWTQKINKNVVNIKIPKRYLSWKITIKYITG